MPCLIQIKYFYSIILIALCWCKLQIHMDKHWSARKYPRFIIFPINRFVEGYFIGKSDWAENPKSQGVEIPPIILGDGAFPIRTWLQKPYGNAVLSEEQRYFNFRLSKGRLVTEGAFGRLKSRFRVLRRRCI